MCLCEGLSLLLGPGEEEGLCLQRCGFDVSLGQRRFAIMASFDACGQFLAFLGACHTPGQDQSLLNQALIPVTMTLAFVYLKARYSRLEIFGAIIILGGATMAVLPSMIAPSQSVSSTV